MKYTFVLALVFATACGGSSSPLAPTAPAAPQTSTLHGSISGGEVGRCGVLAVPCVGVGPYTARAGTFKARVLWEDNDTFLFVELVDAQRRQIVLSSVDASSTTNHRSHSLSANVPDGQYYLHVWYVIGSHITPFDLVADWMN